MIILRHGILEQEIQVATPPTPSYPTDGLLARYDFNDTLNDTYGSFNGWESQATPAEWSYGESGVINKDFKTNVTTGWSSGGAQPKKCLKNVTDASLYGMVNGTGKEWAVSFWAKITTAGMTLGYGVTWNDSPSTEKIKVGWYNPGTPRLIVYGASGEIIGYNNDYRDSSWHNYVLNMDATNIKLYVDTAEVASGSRVNLTGADICGIGANAVATDQILMGEIDLVYFYNKAISTGDITQLYNGGSGI